MKHGPFSTKTGLGRGLALLAALAAGAVLLVACDIFPGDGGIQFPPAEPLYIAYNNERTVVWPVTLLAEGGGPLNGYTWSLASGSSFPSGTTVDPLTGVFKATGGTVSRTPTTFKMTVTAGSYTATSPPYSVVTMNYGSGLVPTALLQQYQPDVDPNVLQLMDAEPGKAYGASLYVLGGTPPYRWLVNTVYSNDLGNAGLSVSPTTGVVIGTPFSSAAGQTLRFKVIVTDARGDTAVFEPIYSIRVK